MSEVAPLTDAEELKFANMLLALKGPVEFECDYTNWRGEKSTRRVRPIGLWHGSTDWHPTPCLLLKAVDLEKNAERDFKLVDFDLSTIRALDPTTTTIEALSEWISNTKAGSDAWKSAFGRTDVTDIEDFLDLYGRSDEAVRLLAVTLGYSENKTAQ